MRLVLPRRRRSILAAAALLVAILAVASLAASWFVAGLAADATITLRTGERKLQLEVVAVTDTEITFHSLGDSNLRTNGIWGIEWRDEDGGWARVGDVLRIDEGRDEVTRARVPGWPAPPLGVRARLDIWAFPGDPGGIGLPFQDVTYEAPEGAMPAWFVPGTRSTWVIYTHGRGSERREALRTLPTVARLGLPALVLTYRNDPEAPGPRTQYEFGATEWPDIEAAVRYALGHGATDVILYGYSMGAVTELSFLNHSSLASSVRAVIMDAPMLDLHEMIERGLGDAGIPSPVRFLPLWVMARRYGLDWDVLDYLHHDECLTMPTLLFHGVQDDSVAVDLSDRFVARHPGLIEYHRIEGAGHTQSWNADPAEYEAALAAFLARVLPAVAQP
ncbi:MAG: alpha/beta hydrolase [Dehalococcoidia bacterium]|nr:alpha/beta hydrolase [Dehalococcoidia bacterium]